MRYLLLLNIAGQSGTCQREEVRANSLPSLMETPFFHWIAGWEKLVKLVKLAFWKNSIGHRDTINLMLFCLSNRYSPHLITKRLLLSNLGPCESRKDSTQIEFVVNYAKKRETITNFCIEQPTEAVNTILQRRSSKTKKIKKKIMREEKTLQCRTQNRLS